mgnify:CR=1 FL=1
MKSVTSLLLITLMLSSCGAKKSLEIAAPFTLGEVFAQKWVLEDSPATQGYEVVISILSLSEDEAVLKNLYHKGKMVPIEIKLKEIGTVGVAEIGITTGENNAADTIPSEPEQDAFPFDLTETQAVISYVQNKKVRYYRIDGIQRNLPVSYPTALAKMKQ